MLEEKIKAALDEVRPNLQMDGGDVEFVSFDEADGVLKVKLTGHCHGCPMSMVTLQQGIARTVQKQVPEVKVVLAV